MQGWEPVLWEPQGRGPHPADSAPSPPLSPRTSMFLPTVCEEQNLLEEQFVLFCKTQRVLLRRNGRFSKIEEEKGGFSSDYYLQMKTF